MSAYTQADLDSLKQAVLRQELSVSLQGRTVTFDSFESLMKRIEFVRRDLEGQSGRTRLLSEFSKGVNC